MKLVKPIKGFSLSKNLGALLFYTAVLSGTVVTNKAMALETPELPPSIILSSAKNSSSEVKTNNVKSEVKNEIKKAIKNEIKKEELKTKELEKDVKEVKAELKDNQKKENEGSVQDFLALQNVKSIVASQQNDLKSKKELDNKEQDNKEQDNKEQDNKEEESSGVLSNTNTVIESAIKHNANFIASSIASSTILSEEEVEEKEEYSVSDYEIKPEEEIKPITKTVSRSETKSNAKPETIVETKSLISSISSIVNLEGNDSVKTSDDNSKKNKIEKKVDNKKIIIAEKKQTNEKTSKKVVTKVYEKSEAKVSKNFEPKKETKALKERKVSKKVVVDESVCPPEWDWFSAPLVFVKDANGKMVLRADKNAPKIVLNKSSRKSCEDVVSSKKQVAKISKKNKASTNKKTLIVPETKKSDLVKPTEKISIDLTQFVEAPDASNEKVVDSKVIKEEKVVDKIAKASINDFKPTVEVEEKQPQKQKVVTLVEKPIERKALFAEAVEKMSKIKELRALESKNRNIVVSKAVKPNSMVRMNRFVTELINRTEKDICTIKQNDLSTNISSQAPPRNELKNNKNNTSSRVVKAENITNNSNNSTFCSKLNSLYFNSRIKLQRGSLYN